MGDERGAEPDPGMAGDDRLSLELARDVFAVFDAHGFTPVQGDAGVGRAVGSVWQAARDYEGWDATRIMFDPDPPPDPAVLGEERGPQAAIAWYREELP